MKISPVSSAGNSVDAMAPAAPQSMVNKIRSIRMATNATPGSEMLSGSDHSDPAQAATEETKPLSPQLAALAKQRRALEVKERAIAEREKALEGRSPTQADVIDRARLKSDPLGSLLEAGVTYAELTEAVLANQNDSPLRSMEAKLKALEEGFDKRFTDRDAQQEQQALAEMGREAKSLIAQGEEFELVRATRSVPTVLELIEKTYRQTGEVMDVKEALTLVEEELFKDISPLASLGKVQSRLAPKPVQPQQQQRPMRTLTNRDTASVPLSAKARAIAAFNGTLKR